MTNKSKSVNNQMKFGAIVSYITIGFNILAGLIYTPWLIKQIGQSDFGLYTLSVSIIGFIAMDFGLEGAVSRFMSKYRAEGNKEKENDFLGLVYKLFIILDAIIFFALIIIYIFIENIYIGLTPVEIEKLKVLYVISGLFTVMSFPFMTLNGILVSHERFVFYKSVTLFQKIITIALMIIALVLGYGLYSIVVVNSVVGIIAITVKYLYIKKNTKVKINIKYYDSYLLKQVSGFLLWSTVIILAERFILNITPTVLGIFANTIQIAVFAISMTIEGYIRTFAQAINGLFLPKVSRMIAEERKANEFEDLMIKVGRIQLVVIGLIIIGFISLGQEFIILWVGEGFKDSYLVALLLILPLSIYLTQEIGNTMIMAQNKVKYRAFATVITAVISFPLSIFLIDYYGAIGAAIAIFIGNALGVVIFINIIFTKVLKINVFRFFKECHLKMLLPIFITCIIGFIMQKYLPVESLLLFMCKAGLLALIYLALMYFISFNLYERNLFLGLLKGASNRIRKRG